MRYYPALDVALPSPAADAAELILAAVDDYAPVAIEERADGLRCFFATETLRDAAAEALTSFHPPLHLATVTVGDENWAERSQAALTAIAVGRIVVAPPWATSSDATTATDTVRVVIEPSMGFGTGHHASTRLCLALLQQRDLGGQAVLDVGTGSGVLAIAAWKLGAASALGIDSDPDAIESATDSVARNQAAADVRVMVADITAAGFDHEARFGVTLANLTGGLLVRIAPSLVRTLGPGGVVIASGFETHERDEVVAAFAAAGARAADELTESGWMGMSFTA